MEPEKEHSENNNSIEEPNEEDEEEAPLLQFHQMGLDDRLLKAIAYLGWKEPTLIQGIFLLLVTLIILCTVHTL